MPIPSRETARTRREAVDAVPRDEPVELYEDPTPRLEAKADHLLLTTLHDLGETAWDVTETVATDGGATVDGLAEQLAPPRMNDRFAKSGCELNTDPSLSFFDAVDSLSAIVSKCVETEAVVQQWHGESMVGTRLNSVPHERTK